MGLENIESVQAADYQDDENTEEYRPGLILVSCAGSSILVLIAMSASIIPAVSVTVCIMYFPLFYG